MNNWKLDCFYHDIVRDMGATIDMCSLTLKDKNFDYKGCLNCNRYLKRDLVQVVRCKDCKYFYLWGPKGKEKFDCDRFIDAPPITPDWYCAWGERREDAEKTD